MIKGDRIGVRSLISRYELLLRHTCFAVAALKHRDIDRRSGHVRAKLRNVGNQHDRPAKDQLDWRNLAADLPNALGQDGVEQLRLSRTNCPLHLQ